LGVARRDAALFARTAFCAPPATLTLRGDALYVRLVRSAALRCALTGRRQNTKNLTSALAGAVQGHPARLGSAPF
jgi:hypothetical protein